MNKYWQPLISLNTQLQRLVEGKLWLKVMIGLFLGLVFGVLLGPNLGLVGKDTALLIGNWMALPGLLFLALVQMIVVPLVCASIILGMTASSDTSQLKRLGIAAAVFFITTTAIASVAGISLGNWVQPGQWIDSNLVKELLGEIAATETQPEMPSLTSLPANLVGLLPRNPLASLAAGEMLQIILFSAVVGVALLQLPKEKSQPLFALVGSLQAISMTVVSWAMLLAPFAVFGLMVRLTSSIGLSLLTGLAAYVFCVLAGLLCLFIGYCVLVVAATPITARHLLSVSRETLLLAFSTSSSAAVMPMSLETAEKHLGVSEATARFIIPLGATVNMTGTALYQGVAIAFMAQIFGIELGTTAILLLVTMTVSASIGSPAAPGASIVILGAMLESVGIPAAGVALLLGVDRLLDMSRTTVNVFGDISTCVLLDRYVGVKAKEENASTPS